MLTLQSYLPFSLPLSIQLAVLVTVGAIIYFGLVKNRPYSGIPIATLSGQSPKQSWLNNGEELLEESSRKFSGPFQILTGTGPKIVLPNKYADELRNNPDLDFGKAFSGEFFTNYHGFEPFKFGLEDDHIIQDTVRIKLTQSLNLVTDDLVDETTASLNDILGNESEWHSVEYKQHVLDIVTRLSSRVFLGLPLCRNERWIEISKNYTINSFIGSYILRMVPALTRPIAYWFIPQMKVLRKAIKDAHKMIDAEVEKRKARVIKAHEAGVKPPKTADAIGWMFEVAKGQDIDYVAGQLSLSLAAIHTTSETTSWAMYHLCQHPEVVRPLREEAIAAIKEYGWAKTTLYKLRLMDSFLKESQRLNPLSRTSMNRSVEQETKLSDGTVLPKNSKIMVTSTYMDSSVYPDPEKFDAARFLKLREETGQDSLNQVVALSPQHLLFGLGQHACPGRFFATNEIKILLCHLILKYDWRFVNGQVPEFDKRFSGDSVPLDTKIEVRRRKEEINLDLEIVT